MYFEMRKNPSLAQPYWFVIKSNGNHAVLMTSEMYKHKTDALDMVVKIAREAGESKYFDQTGEA